MKLTDYLRVSKMTRNQFAAVAGIARTTVMRLLDHGYIPQRATAQKIVAATDGAVSEADLVAEAAAARISRPSGQAA
jgi:hypothetical protein